MIYLLTYYGNTPTKIKADDTNKIYKLLNFHFILEMYPQQRQKYMVIDLNSKYTRKNQYSVGINYV